MTPARAAVLRAVLLGAALLALPRAGSCGIRDDDKLNYKLEVPDTWTFMPDLAPFQKYPVVQAAKRQLEKLADGRDARGEGGRAFLSVKPVPASFPKDYEDRLFRYQRLLDEEKRLPPRDETDEKTGPARAEIEKKIDEARADLEKDLAALAALPEVQDILLDRWGDSANRPAAEIESRGEDVMAARLPAARVTVKAPCLNWGGVVAPCHARLVVCVVKKQMYRLALWAWPTERDREQLKSDLDSIDYSFDIPKAEAIPPKVEIKEPQEDPAAKPALEGDAGETKTITEESMGFSVVKPVKFKSKEIDRSVRGERALGFSFEAVSTGGSVTIQMMAHRAAPKDETPYDLKRHFTDEWAAFLKEHKAGAIETCAFPPASPRNPFLSLPDLAKKKEVKRPPEGEEFSNADLERAGVLSEVKNASAGREKLKDAQRFVAKGNVERMGDDWWIQYAFTAYKRIYILRIYVRKDGWTGFRDGVAEILKSLTFFEEK